MVFEVFRVGEGGMVENEDVGEGCADKVYYEAKKPTEIVSEGLEARKLQKDRPCDKIQRQGLPPYVIPWPSAHVSIP